MLAEISPAKVAENVTRSGLLKVVDISKLLARCWVSKFPGNDEISADARIPGSAENAIGLENGAIANVRIRARMLFRNMNLFWGIGTSFPSEATLENDVNLAYDESSARRGD